MSEVELSLSMLGIKRRAMVSKCSSAQKCCFECCVRIGQAGFFVFVLFSFSIRKVCCKGTSCYLLGRRSD